MKKCLLFLIGMIGIPCLICVIVCGISPELSIGQGERNMKNCGMGKDVLIEIDGLYKQLDVEEYVLGVMAGVISPEYEDEALKVQAVLIRTNLLKEMQERGTKDAEDIPYHYVTVEERKGIWGERQYAKYERKMEHAVIDTAGKVLQAEGNLILACYHEVSIGKTASAKEVLGEDISYLQSVESSWDVEAKHYMNLMEYSWEDVANCISEYQKEKQEKNIQATQEEETAETELDKTQQPDQEKGNDSKDRRVEIQIEESSENGFVKKIKIAEDTYTGEEVMQMLHLPSMNFYIEEKEDGVRIVCLGKGNCMGVSQYGANYMAKEGKNMEQILDYYLKNVSLKRYQELR